MSKTPSGTHNEFRRLPGLFRRWEFAQVIEAGVDYRVEEAGMAADGTSLYAVYAARRATSSAETECASLRPGS